MLTDSEPAPGLTARARLQPDVLTEAFDGVRDERTALVRDLTRNRETWWTFAGGNANAALATGLRAAGISVIASDDLSIGMHRPVGYQRLQDVVETLRREPPIAEPGERQVESLKFGEALSLDMALGCRERGSRTHQR